VKDLVILGGPNGAGKTTAAARLLPADLNIREFVNADEIARGLSPFNPEGSAIPAGRLMIRRIRDLAKTGESFAFETTCAGRSHLRLLQFCRDIGYRLTLVFLWLSSAEAAVARVARRVDEGGHSIPKNVIVRRYYAGLRNMRHFYLPAVDIASIFDNSEGAGSLIAERQAGGHLIIHDKVRWAMIEEATR
jgi:predicted ABC-type ATPase